MSGERNGSTTLRLQIPVRQQGERDREIPPGEIPPGDTMTACLVAIWFELFRRQPNIKISDALQQ